jgi:hypothetical protein
MMTRVWSFRLQMTPARALLAVRELVCDAIKQGGDLVFDAVVIADARGNEIASVRASEVVPKRLRLAAGSTAERTGDNLIGRVHPAVISTHS